MWQTVLDWMLRSLIGHGGLSVRYPDGQIAHYGTGDGPVLVLRDEATVRRLVLDPKLALGECYMDGSLTIEGDDLHGMLEVMVRSINKEPPAPWVKARRAATRLGRRVSQLNGPRAARANVAHHYDLTPALYDLFLDADKQYSCAYFRTPHDTLEQAQAQKKAHIGRKLLIEPEMRVLDIGCGWGGLALTLARDFGARVVGITLSEEQLAIAQRRAEAAGLAERVEFRLQDYRHVTEVFDRVVSVGMFEHVGLPNYGTYFRAVYDCLNSEGVALIHTIGRPAPPEATNPFIARHIFPGGYVPALSDVSPAIERSGLRLCDLECWRLHYAYTLRHWFDRFTARAAEAEAIHDARFVRMWRFYLAASEQAFRYGRQDVWQIQLARKVDAVPITRDYLYAVSAASSPVSRPHAVLSKGMN